MNYYRQSLILLLKCFKLDCPNYSSQLCTTRITNYNLRGSALNVVQPPYNSLVMHNSFPYKIAHMRNQLPAITKYSTTLAQFRSRLNGAEFLGSQCATSAWMRRSICTHLVVSRACEINDKTAIFA